MLENNILNDRYHLEAEIGRGGMGVVYRARDIKLNRVVAVKVLPAEFVHNAQFLARFNSEILNSAQLQHTNIVSIFDVGVEGNTNYYVMQFIDGQDLKSYLLHHGPLTIPDAGKILNEIASALDYAHSCGIVHRDIKPENILIDRHGISCLTDFGIARSLEGTRMTTGMVGTPEYMSPEQGKGEEVDGRSDQYSLAIVAYEMLTGTTPFRSASAQQWSLVHKHISEAPADPRLLVPALANNCAQALLKALAKSAAQRFLSCGSFVDEIFSNSMRNRASYPVAENTNVQSPVPQTTPPLIPTVLFRQNEISIAPPAHSLISTEQPIRKPAFSEIKMITIPAGEFLYGPHNELNYWPDFKIMQYPVTVAQYREFCAATNRTMFEKPGWGWRDTHPVVNVTWNDAAAFAAWAGMTLPSEKEWEKAARGVDGRNYPWGNQWDAANCHNSAGRQAVHKTAAVGSYPAGASFFGVEDMTGNVWEWCNDWHREIYGKRVLRGGSWHEDSQDFFRITFRSGRDPSFKLDSCGFRCVLC